MERRPDLVLDAEPSEKWSIYSSSQNLASVLNDPSLPRADILTKDWGAKFIESPPIVPLYPPPTPNDLALIETYRKRVHRREEKLAAIKRSSISSDNLTDFGASSKSKDIHDIVPRLFLRSDFSLENVNTFTSLLSDSKSVNCLTGNNLSSSPDSFKESIKQISRNLTDYLDVVEENLSHQISLRFREFFHIMNAIDSVMENLSKTIKQVTLLRGKCQQLEATFVKPNLENIRLHWARQNALKVLDKMQLMSTINQTQPTIQLLLSNSDFAGSLDLISTTQDVFLQELLGLHCFRHLESQLNEIREIISKMMKEEFIKFIDAFCNQPVDPSIGPISMDNLTINKKNQIPGSDRLEALVMGMLKNHCFSFIDDFNKEARMAIKAFVKQTVIEMLSQEDDIDIDGKEEMSLFERLRSIDPSKWLKLLSIVFVNLNLLLDRMELIQVLMLRVVQEASEKRNEDTSKNQEQSNHILADKDYNKLSITIKESLVAICDDAHLASKDLIRYKANDGSLDKLTSAEFLELSKSIDKFTSECETRCGRRSDILESVLKNQAFRFTTRFHDERKRKLNSVLTVEQWKSLDPIPVELQEMINQFSEERLGSRNPRKTETKDESTSESNQLPSSSSQSSVSSTKSTTSSVKTTTTTTSSSASKSYVTLNDENYVVVSSMKTLISMILEYCQCCNEIPSLTSELLARLLDLISHFNTRTCHLVLEGGAANEAGLKSINVRNLFLSQRCLQLVISLLPYLSSHFCDLMPTKNRSTIKSFEDIERGYTEHVQKIPEKVISLVKDFMIFHLSKWEAKPPVPSQPFQTISQHLMRLHENIQDVIPIGDLSNFFIRLHELFKEVLRSQLTRLKIANDGGPQHGLVTQELTFYVINLNNLSIGKKLKFSIDDLWSKIS
ncbi:vacuolar protein sorting-associated protein 54-like [Panonychus citri]|uniref:vacuolar protein sorting-associated protein 54-like n=1 Tax=Panonychus citri TaxID=50023 RepID=UPI002307F9EA|nr:vacuolar protein sorting-associated protein 54-like [Panonychus citri]